MTTLNRQRTNIVFSTLFDEDRILAPAEASKYERIFEKDGILRWKASPLTLGSCQIGVSLQELFLSASISARWSNSIHDVSVDISSLLALFQHEEYILWYNHASRHATIALKKDVTPISQLKAWSHALMLSQIVVSGSLMEGKALRLPESSLENLAGRKETTNLPDHSDFLVLPALDILESTLKTHSERFDSYISRLREAGWELDTPALETRPGKRFEISNLE